MTPRAKCAKPVSPTECVPSPRVPSVQFSCSRASHGPRVLISTWKWLVKKNTRGCILSRQHILAFISLVFLFLFFLKFGLSPGSACLWSQAWPRGFSYCARKGDVNPNNITYCCSIISGCKVSVIVQQVVICESIYILSNKHYELVFQKDVLVALS